MTNEELIRFCESLGFVIDQITGSDGKEYLVIKNYQIPAGVLAGSKCDVAIQKVTMVPYVAPAAIHTFPALVPYDMGTYKTMQSNVGEGWQYWSRILRGVPSPRAYIAHIATIFSEVKV